MELPTAYHLAMLLALLVSIPSCHSFTVIMPDYVPPSSSADAVQPGSPTSRTGARTEPTEQQAVCEIMRATGNDWAATIPDVCRGRWHGIECIPHSDGMLHVVSLSFGVLSDDTAFPTCNSARPTISPAIAKLTHLRTLFFYNCLGSNPQLIPSFVGKLGSTLRTLVLRGNGLIGPIPNELGKLSGLGVLDLHGNCLEGSIPATLGRLGELRTLDLSRNRLTGEVPRVFHPKLTVLDLNQNRLNGPLPRLLLSSDSLIKIDLSRNRFVGGIPKLTGLTDLILLDLSHNALAGPLPESLASLKSLQALVLRGNPSTARRLSESTFVGLSSLVVLDLSHMNLEGSIPESIGDLKALRVLRLHGNRLNGSIPASFAGLSGLTELRLEGNTLTGPIPLAREKIWKMGRNLRVGNNLGLCYDAGIEDDLSALSGDGVPLCAAETSRQAIGVEHVAGGSVTSESTSLSGFGASRMKGLAMAMALPFARPYFHDSLMTTRL